MLERLNEGEIVRYTRHLYFLDCMKSSLLPLYAQVRHNFLYLRSGYERVFHKRILGDLARYLNDLDILTSCNEKTSRLGANSSFRPAALSMFYQDTVIYTICIPSPNIDSYTMVPYLSITSH